MHFEMWILKKAMSAFCLPERYFELIKAVAQIFIFAQHIIVLCFIVNFLEG